MDKELVDYKDFREISSVIGNTENEWSKQHGNAISGLNIVGEELDRMNRVLAGGIANDIAKQYRGLSWGMAAPLADEMARASQVLAGGIANDIAKHRRAITAMMSPFAGELPRADRVLAGGIANDIIKQHRGLSWGMAAPLADEMARASQVLAGGIANDIARQHRGLSWSMAAPLADEMARASQVLAGGIANDIAKHRRAITATLSPIAGELPGVNRVLGQSASPIAHALFAIDLGTVLEKNGWFPHYTMPEELIAKNKNRPELNEVLIDYYRRNWRSVRRFIEQRLDRYLVDAESKAAFRECLDAHENGFYRLVCRSSFPEVERIIRVEINHNKVGQFSVQKLVRQHFDDLPVSVFPNSKFGFAGYRQFTEHLYAQVNSEDDRQRLLSHQVPNRHASIHGLIPYASEQSSLNSIFAAEYVLELVTKWKLFEKDAVLRT